MSFEITQLIYVFTGTMLSPDGTGFLYSETHDLITNQCADLEELLMVSGTPFVSDLRLAFWVKNKDITLGLDQVKLDLTLDFVPNQRDMKNIVELMFQRSMVKAHITNPDDPFPHHVTANRDCQHDGFYCGNPGTCTGVPHYVCSVCFRDNKVGDLCPGLEVGHPCKGSCTLFKGSCTSFLRNL